MKRKAVLDAGSVLKLCEMMSLLNVWWESADK